MTRTHTAPTGQKRSFGTNRTAMFINLLLGLFLCGALLGLTGCDYPTSGELIGEYENTSVDELEDNLDTSQSIAINGRTMTSEGIALSDSWVAIFDHSQKVLAETFSDQNGNFDLAFVGENDDYTLMAAYQDDFGSLVAWEEFSLSEENQRLVFELTLVDPPSLDLEESDDSARSCAYSNHYGYYYGLCWLTHRFYAYKCQPCYPYHCTYFTAGSC